MSLTKKRYVVCLSDTEFQLKFIIIEQNYQALGILLIVIEIMQVTHFSHWDFKNLLLVLTLQNDNEK